MNKELNIDLVRNAMDSKGLNQKKLAETIDVSRTIVTNWFKGDKFPIGAFLGENLQNFTNHEFDLKEGDIIYIFSDGYADQFGGPDGRKFMYKPFRELLISIHEKPMDEQKEILYETLTQWRGDEVQIDDILVIGIRI